MFIDIRKKVEQRFKELLEAGTLFKVDVDKGKIWELYLAAFSEEKRQENQCNCCKSFIRQFAGIVAIKNNERITLWDFETDDKEYKEPMKALRKYIKSLPISGIFLNSFAKIGTDKTPDTARGIVWNHFFLQLPAAFVKSDSGPLEGTARDNKNVLQRSLNEITDDAVDTTLDLINQGSLYRGSEFKGMISEFKTLKARYKTIKPGLKDNFCWVESGKTNGAVNRIRNTSIGTLLNDLSEGKELDKAVAAFERVVAPTNYKRPTALVTPRMIEDARKRLEELGLVHCLNRKLLCEKDLNVNNVLFVDRPIKVESDIFDQIKKDVTVNPKTLSKIEEISVKDFIEKVLPTSKSIKVLVENRHLSNFVTLVGAKEESEDTLFKWGNNFSWSYTGAVTDSIKERVKTAGGNVDGLLRISLSWDNRDDLDLYLKEPGGGRVFYGNKGVISSSGAVLDLDANGLSGMRDDPVENIYWKSLPRQEGRYKVGVNQFSRRENMNSGWELEIEFDGETYNFSGDDNGRSGNDIGGFDFTYTQKDGVKILGNVMAAKTASKEKWGVSTNQFHKVKSITLSPNYWENNIGNKHFFFFLENCISDEPTRGIYNEFLKEELAKDRKVFEILGSKIITEKTENELSGLGFSETVKASVIIEVTGTFKRLLKINF